MCRTHWLLVPVVLLSLPLCAQSQIPAQQPQQEARPPVMINFFQQVDANTVNMLVTLVDAQVRAGSKKIILLLSSAGGETTSAFTAYNYLRGLRTAGVDITTFNVGNVDSAATVIYCAGIRRFSLPGTRFILHGVQIALPGNTFLNAQGLQSQLALHPEPKPDGC
jgi:ATP-dependent protease ClpP protease subunit